VRTLSRLVLVAVNLTVWSDNTSLYQAGKVARCGKSMGGGWGGSPPDDRQTRTCIGWVFASRREHGKRWVPHAQATGGDCNMNMAPPAGRHVVAGGKEEAGPQQLRGVLMQEHGLLFQNTSPVGGRAMTWGGRLLGDALFGPAIFRRPQPLAQPHDYHRDQKYWGCSQRDTF
jgi:hypothetical protein